VIMSATTCMLLGIALGARFKSFVLIPASANSLLIALAAPLFPGGAGQPFAFVTAINAIALEIGYLCAASFLVIADYPPLGSRRRVGRTCVAVQTAPISIMMVGLRGCPGVQGGIERHVENLAPLLAARNCEVEVIARAPYVGAGKAGYWRGVAVTPLWAPRRRNFETIVHTAVAILYAAARRPDILHIHAIGPSILTPLARLFGLRVVVTHHGFDYERAKWKKPEKLVLKLGEYLGMRFSSARIAVSAPIARTVERRFRTPTTAIPNGVTIEAKEVSSTSAIEAFDLTPKRFILSVGRLVPEKRHIDLISAFEKAAAPGWKLAIVGASDYPGAYLDDLKDLARKSPNVVMTGFQSGTALAELYAHAGLFVLPSSHEGLSIALLEGMAAGLPVLASDITANRDVQLPEECYFPVGNVDRLAAMIALAVRNPFSDADRRAQQARLSERYDWAPIAERTLKVYRQVMGDTLAGDAVGGV